MRPSAQYCWTSRTEIFHLRAASCTVTYSIVYLRICLSWILLYAFERMISRVEWPRGASRGLYLARPRAGKVEPETRHLDRHSGRIDLSPGRPPDVTGISLFYMKQVLKTGLPIQYKRLGDLPSFAGHGGYLPALPLLVPMALSRACSCGHGHYRTEK